MRTQKTRCCGWRDTCKPLRTLQTDGVKVYWEPSGWSERQYQISNFKSRHLDSGHWSRKEKWLFLYFRRRILTRCLACIVFSLFPESEAQHREYETAIDELKTIAKSKKYADVKANAVMAIDIVENQTKSINSTKENICAIIRLFYNNCYLASLEGIWIF